MPPFETLKIKEVVRETPTAISLIFDIPENRKPSFTFVPGQFITLKAIIDNEEVRRSYSISSSPNDSELRVCIKKVENGKFSTYANEQLKANDAIEVMPPEGKFQLKTDSSNSKNYIAFAAGSGITPILSMIKSVLNEELNSKFVLLYGNKSPEETVYYNELNSLKNEFADRFFIEYAFSQKNIEDAYFGRIDKNIVDSAIQNTYKELPFSDYYLCGPEAMINTVKEILLTNAVSNDSVHVELFTSTNTATNNEAEGVAKVHIVIDDEEVSIEADKKVTLLDNALKNDVDAPYSCKGGVCCSCICRVIEGEANMPVNNLLTDAEVKEGLILACQSYAVSDSIKIDFDDA